MASRPSKRVFLDSNVILSGLYSPKGPPGIILEHFVKGNISVVVSRQVLEEVIRTVKEKIPGVLPALRTLLINAPPEITADPKLEEIERWTGKMPFADAAILAAAVVSEPDYFVTGDKHFTGKPEIAEKAGLRVVTPEQFLKVLQQDNR